MRKNAILFSAGEYQNSKTFPKPTCDLSGVKVDILAIEKRLKQIGLDLTKKENINKLKDTYAVITIVKCNNKIKPGKFKINVLETA